MSTTATVNATRTAAMLLKLDEFRARRLSDIGGSSIGATSLEPVCVGALSAGASGNGFEFVPDGPPIPSGHGFSTVQPTNSGSALPTGAAGRSLLEIATLTVTAYPDCGEASVVIGLSGGPTLDIDPFAHLDAQLPLYPAAVSSGPAADPERSRNESAARARRKLRRWCVANKADRLCTFTFAGDGCHDLPAVWRHLEAFRRDLRALAGADVPIALVPELHPGGHGWHVHGALGKFVDYRVLRKCWSHGFVHVKKLKPRQTATRIGKPGGRAQCRETASYLAKYVVKGALDGTVPTGKKRYSVPKGFQPVAVKFRTVQLAVVLDHLRELFGSEVVRVWSSTTVEDWCGPPVDLWFALD